MTIQDSAPDTHESRFISAARLLMICGLVWHHLFEIPGSTHSPRAILQGVTHFVPELINSFVHMAMMTAVPMLSVISGFLFFRRSEINYGRLIGSRFRTVALPTWLWSALWFGIGWFLYTLARNAGWVGAPGLAWLNYASESGGFEDLGANTLVNGVFAVSREPFAMQFWFVHDLLITIVLSPVIYFFLQMMNWRLLVLAALLWLALPDPPLLFSGNVPTFFALGAWLTLPRSPSLGTVLRRIEAWRWTLTGLLTVALLLRIFSHDFGGYEAMLRSHQYLCLLRVLGVLALAAQISRLVSLRDESTMLLERYSCYSFFIFAAHYPLIEIVQFGVVNIPGHASALGMLLSWLLVPLVTILCSLALALALERHMPAAFSVLNGGRGTHTAYATVRAERRVKALRRDMADPAPDTR